MTAIAPRTRDARIYRVNAWREMKGRPALPFDVKPGGPEWWTAENTRLWNIQTWGHPKGASEAQGVWKDKLQGGRKAGALCYKPLTLKEMAKWRINDRRPTPITFYDGKVDPKRASLPNAVK